MPAMGAGSTPHHLGAMTAVRLDPDGQIVF